MDNKNDTLTDDVSETSSMMQYNDDTLTDDVSETSSMIQYNDDVTICDVTDELHYQIGSDDNTVIVYETVNELQYPIDKDHEKSIIADIIYKNPKYSAMTTFSGYDTSVAHFNSWTKQIDGGSPKQLIDIVIDPQEHPSVHNFNNMVAFISPVWTDTKLNITDIKNISITYDDDTIISLSGSMCYNILTLHSKLIDWVDTVIETSNVVAMPIQYLLMENDILNLSALTSPLHVKVQSNEHISVIIEMECYTVSKAENLNFINSVKTYRRFHYDCWFEETQFGFEIKMKHTMPVSNMIVVVGNDSHLNIKLDNMTFASGKSLYSSMLQILDNRPDRPTPAGSNAYYLSSNKMNITDKHSITDHYIIKDKMLHIQLMSSSDEEEQQIIEGDPTPLVIIIKMTGTMTFPNYNSENVPHVSTTTENIKTNNSNTELNNEETNTIMNNNSEEFVILNL